MPHHYFTAHEFASLSRTTKATLHHYDRIGLLSPLVRGENKYRYYAQEQLSIINVIQTFQEFGMSLAEIKKMRERRTPKYIDELLGQHITQIDEKIEAWINTRKFLLTMQKMINSTSNVNTKEITVEHLSASAIVLGSRNEYGQDRDNDSTYEALHRFYDEMRSKYRQMNLSYPVWGFFSKERMMKRDWQCPERYYFYNPSGYDERPEGLYAIGYTHGSYGQTNELYERMMAYIDKNGYEVCGGAYEEYPLNEICVAESKDYLIRAMITVRKK